jgi:hypothetical protein
MDPEPNRVAGSYQKDAFKIHYHGIAGTYSDFSGPVGDVDKGTASMYRTDGYKNDNAVYNTGTAFTTTDPTDVNDSETRAKNAAVYYYLRIN